MTALTGATSLRTANSHKGFLEISFVMPKCPWKSPFGNPFRDVLVQALVPKRFMAITCTIWLRLEFRGQHSVWFFSAHLLYFHAQGQILEPRIGFWTPGSTFWPGCLFGTKKWSRKKLFCGGMILWWGFRRIHPAQMNSMVPGTYMGRLLCPQPPLKKQI